MKNPILFGGLSALALSVVSVTHVQAKGLGQQSLEEVVVVGKKAEGSLTSVSVSDARKRLEKIPGGIGFVDVADYRDNFTQSLGDTLVFTPGVFADTSAQRENRISIRGSGLSATFERRGINVYRDGVPITRASGITEFQEVDPLSVKYIEVFKGGNGIRYGTNSLGGAINIVTPTGKNTEAGSKLRVEAGSFDSTRVNLSSVGQVGAVDYSIGVTKLDSDGFREHSDVDSIYGFGNIGFSLTDSIETRFYFTSLEDNFELASSVSLEEALENPETAIGTNFVPPFLSFLGIGTGQFDAITDDFDRNLTVNRIANRTVFAFDNWQLETGVWVANRELDHAITRFVGIIVQDEDEVGASIRASNERYAEGGVVWSIGASLNQSDNNAQVFFNDFGQRGAQRSQDQQDAENFSVYGELIVPLNDKLSVIGGLQYNRAERENEHIPLNAFDTEDDSGSLTFNELSPRLGILWNVSDRQQVYANVNQAFEAPGITDLTAGGSAEFNPLTVQESTTVELGSRGQSGNVSWDVSVYRSIVKDEFIDFTPPFGGPASTVNADSDTIHQGIEAGVDWSPKIAFLNSRDTNLVWRNILTINDFRFDDSETFGNNKLAGVPDFNYLTELSLVNESWNIGLNVRYVDNGPFADFANTVQTEGYTLVGLNGAYDVSDNLHLFFSAENIGDENYISNIGTADNASVDDQRFTPGQGRAYYAGFSYKF